VEHLLNWLWQGSAVALATDLILRLLTRARAQSRYALCWIVLLIVLSLPLLPLLLTGTAASPEPIASPPPASAVMIAVPNAWWTRTTIVLAVWAVWSGVQSMRITTALLALRRARRRCRAFPAIDESQLAHWNSVRAQGRRTRLVLSEDVRAAAVLGYGSPVIAVAPALIGHLDRAELDRVVIHEWAHVQRQDDVLNLAQLAAQALAGWHPAVWWLNRQLHIERESACDEATIALTGSAKGYAASLAKAAGLPPATRQMPLAVGALSSPGLRSRIIRILSHSRLVSRPWSASTAMTAALTLVVLAFCLAGFRVIGRAVVAAPVEPRQAFDMTPVDRTDPATFSSTPQSPLQDRQIKPPVRTQAASRRVSEIQEAARDESGAVVTTAPPMAHHTDEHPASAPTMPVLGAVSFDGVPIVPGIGLGPAPPKSQSADAGASTPWSSAADTGVALGRASQRAAVATAGFFSRFGKKIAGSF
jgi:beta-lactamase regulating signal transducer with metallopeptidase domain